MKPIAIFTVTSSLHDAQAVSSLSDAFLKGIFPDDHFEFCGADFSHFGAFPLNLIYVRTGGAEGIFKSLWPQICAQYKGSIYLLTSGKSNSLAASIEILSWLRQQGYPGEILHGRPDVLKEQVRLLEKVAVARKELASGKIGLVGQPSDWLIASSVDRLAVASKLGIAFADIPIEELVTAAKAAPEETFPEDNPMKRDIRKAWPGARQIFWGLSDIQQKYGLTALTLRCFDLLTALGNTGCIALAQLNAQGIPSSCEGDVPALLSMMVSRALTGCTGFQANPSQIDAQTGVVLFAHCTISLDIPTSIQYDTHFESGIGVGIHGEFPMGGVTVLKLSGDLSRAFVAEGEVLGNQYEENLCRTQVRLQLTPEEAHYFLTNPIGNHHILIPGRHRRLMEAFLGSL